LQNYLVFVCFFAARLTLQASLERCEIIREIKEAIRKTSGLDYGILMFTTIKRILSAKKQISGSFEVCRTIKVCYVASGCFLYILDL